MLNQMARGTHGARCKSSRSRSVLLPARGMQSAKKLRLRLNWCVGCCHKFWSISRYTAQSIGWADSLISWTCMRKFHAKLTEAVQPLLIRTFSPCPLPKMSDNAWLSEYIMTENLLPMPSHSAKWQGSWDSSVILREYSIKVGSTLRNGGELDIWRGR